MGVRVSFVRVSFLTKRTAIALPEVSALVADPEPLVNSNNLAQYLINEAIQDLNLTQEEYVMWIDTPTDQPATQPVIYLAAAAAASKEIESSVTMSIPSNVISNRASSETNPSDTPKAMTTSNNYKLGICRALWNPYGTTMYLNSDAGQYLSRFAVGETDADKFIRDKDNLKVAVVKNPDNGIFVSAKPVGKGSPLIEYRYEPLKGFKGKDTIVVDVSNGTYTVQIHYTLMVVAEEDDLYSRNDQGEKIDNPRLCPSESEWKISSIPTSSKSQLAFWKFIFKWIN